MAIRTRAAEQRIAGDSDRSQFQRLDFAFNIMSDVFMEFLNHRSDFLQLAIVHIGDDFGSSDLNFA